MDSTRSKWNEVNHAPGVTREWLQLVEMVICGCFVTAGACDKPSSTSYTVCAMQLTWNLTKLVFMVQYEQSVAQWYRCLTDTRSVSHCVSFS